MHRLAVKAARGLLKRASRDKGPDDGDVKDEVGVSPRLVGAMTAAGANATNPLQRMAVSLYEHIRAGKALSAEAGTPLSEIAELTKGEKEILRSFAKKHGVSDVPIFASGDDLTSALVELNDGGGKGIILGTNSIPEAMHEIGHAVSVNTKAGKVINQLAQHTGAESRYGNLGRIMLGSAVLTPPREDSSATSRFMYNAAPALVGATFAPQLLDEAIASYHALKGSRAHGIGMGTALRDLAPAYGTYVAAAAIPVLATILAKKVVKALYQRAAEKKEAEKSASPMAGREVQSPGGLRSDASSAWRIGGTPPKPKTTTPGGRSARAQETPKAPPPSNAAFHRDVVKSINDPERGSRLAR